jgi:hypothetical protein
MSIVEQAAIVCSAMASNPRLWFSECNDSLETSKKARYLAYNTHMLFLSPGEFGFRSSQDYRDAWALAHAMLMNGEVTP